MIAALRNVIIREATAVPKTFAASLAPNAHPRNKPPLKGNILDSPLGYDDADSVTNIFRPVTNLDNAFDEIPEYNEILKA